MNNPNAAGRLVLGVIELSEFDVQYRSRTAIKAQALANFVVEFTAKVDKGLRAALWMVWMDRLCNRYARGIGVILQSSEGDLIECVV